MGVLDFCLAHIYIEMERSNIADITKCFTSWVSASYIHWYICGIPKAEGSHKKVTKLQAKVNSLSEYVWQMTV